MHTGHQAIAQHAYTHMGRRVWLELPTKNCNTNKPNLTPTQLSLRVSFLRSQIRGLHYIEGLVVSDYATFVDKLALYQRPKFLVGMNTLSKVEDPSSYFNGEQGVKNAIEVLCKKDAMFIVYPRLGSPMHVCKSQRLKEICHMVTQTYEPIDISSTAIRKGCV